MKNILRIGFVALAISFCGVAKAQQINGTFDDTWETCTPYSSGETKSVGTQPQGWKAANVAGYNLVIWFGTTEIITQLTSSKSETHTGNYAVKLENKSVLSNIIPGYMSLGTTWNTANTKGENADGGTFGGKSFTYHPDAIRFYYKRTMASGNSQPGSVVAYLWKGTTTQADVPANVASSATTVTMTNRDANVLNRTYSLGGNVTYSADFELIATIGKENESDSEQGYRAEVYLNDTPSDWTEMTCEFDYHSESNPTMINVIFGAMENYAGKANNESGNTLSVDDVTLLYYHALSALSYEGATIDFSETTTSYDLSSYLYDESKLSYTKKGQGASLTKSYDVETGILTIRVQGEDYDASSNADAYTEYTIQFKPCSASMSISSTAQYATFVAPFDVTVPSGVTAYTVSGYEDGSATLKMTEVSGTIPANTPVILNSESDLTENVYGINSATGTSVTSGLLTGVYSDYQTTGGEYVLQNHDGKVAFYKVDASGAKPWVRANHCYIPASASSAKMLNLNNDATAISTLSALTSGEYESIYSASGAKQNSLQKGVNILKMNDGTTRKVLVK